MRSLLLLLAACDDPAIVTDLDASVPLDAPVCTGATFCDGDDVVACSAGSPGEVVETCSLAEGSVCRRGACANLCEEARMQRSYLGCEYWPVVTPNPALDDAFSFAVVVANPHEAPVTVVVERDGLEVLSRVVEPSSVAPIVLPWVDVLKGTRVSRLVAGGAYHVTTTLPVTAYQFNPLQHVAAGMFSFTNDASLLLPSASLGEEYVGVAWPSFSGAPGFLAIAGTEDDTEVQVLASAAISASPEGDVPALEAGQTHTATIGRGDVLVLASVFDHLGSYGHDVTGTHVRSSKPIAVFGGHACTFIPATSPACDHLEEQIFPLETWGQSAMAATTEPLAPGQPNFFRIVSGTDGNTIALEPPLREPLTLDRGEFVDVELEGALRVEATGRVMLAQYMVSGTYGEVPSMLGDPAFGQAVPEEQFRTSYIFLVPHTYTRNWVTVLKPSGSDVLLDGEALPAPSPIGESGFESTTAVVAPGVHRIESEGDVRFGIGLYGVAPWTSYLYPGGLDLRPVPLL
jgi:hypothetical protein